MKYLPFFIQNYGLTDGRCQHWQVSLLTGVNIDRRKKLQKTIVTIEFTALDSCRVRNFIKIEAFAVLLPKLWPERWQVPTLAGVKNHRKLLSSMNSAPSNCWLCKISWKMVHLIPLPHLLFPISRFPFPFAKIALFWVWMNSEKSRKRQYFRQICKQAIIKL